MKPQILIIAAVIVAIIAGAGGFFGGATGFGVVCGVFDDIAGVGDALTELDGLGAALAVGESGDVRFEGVDLGAEEGEAVKGGRVGGAEHLGGGGIEPG